MGHAGKILKYEMHNLLRSRWLIGIAAVLFLLAEALFRFGGDAHKIRSDSVDFVQRSLGLRTRDWSEDRRLALENLALVLAMIPLEGWSSRGKKLAARIIEAKAAGDEARYLQLMHGHSRLREAIIRLGS